MTHLQVLEGTWEEIKRHEEELAGRRFRLVPLPATPEPLQNHGEVSAQEHGKQRKQLQGLGMFAHVPGGAEAFALQKQKEIAHEDKSSS